MNSDELEYYIEAGMIASKVRTEALNTVEEGVKLLETAEYAENLIRELGGTAAFPCNISINEIASHYTPIYGKRKYAASDLVKIDVGVHVNGYIADTASSIEIDSVQNEVLIRAAQEALEAAIKEIREGVTTKRLGAVMELVIRSYGCHPVIDLTGHSIDRYTVHGGVNIPLHGKTSFTNKLHTGDVIAVEPFTTKGRGIIKYGETRIFSLVPGSKNTNPVFQELKYKFKTLPFTKRWIKNPDELDEIQSCIKKYPVLIESSGYAVAQAEHTVIVEEEGCRVITA